MMIVQVSMGGVRMPPAEGSAPQQVMFNISKQLARMGHNVIILDRKHSRDDDPVEQVDGVSIVRLDITNAELGRAPRFIRLVLAELSAIAYTLAVSSYLKKNGAKIDIVHLHLTSIGLVLTLLNRGLRSKMVYTCHLSQWVFSGKPGMTERIHLFLDSCVMRRVKTVIALNEAAKQSFSSRGKVNEGHIVVVSNGVDTDLFGPQPEIRDAVRKRYGLQGKVTVLFVGRLARIKGVDHLVRAASVIVNEFGCEQMLLLLAGPHVYPGVDPPIDMRRMTKYLKEHRLEHQIKLLGSLPLSELNGLYAACDIFVLPSLAEGDPLVTLEAMASGKPVVATYVGGIPNQIIDGWNGFLVPPEDERRLAERIQHLIDSPVERERMGRNARCFVEERFDWSKIARKLTDVYDEVRREASA